MVQENAQPLEVKAKRGPKGPTKPLTDEDFAKLVAMIRIQCTQDEICSIFGMTAETLNTRLEERNEGKFSTLFKKHSGEGKASLRRAQWKAATVKLNPTMLVWLGKQMLGQRDAPEDVADVQTKAQEVQAALEQMDRIERAD